MMMSHGFKEGRNTLRTLTEVHHPSSTNEIERLTKIGSDVSNLKNSFGDQIGPKRLHIHNREIECISSTRAVGLFSGVCKGLSSKCSLAKTEIGITDLCILMVSFELGETLKDKRVTELLSKGINSKDMDIAYMELFNGFAS